MQTKKRAKPVKFGKTKEEKVTKEVAEADINSDEAKELKKIIEEKTHPKEDEIVEETQKEEISREEEDDKEDELPEQEETTEDEPEEIRLSEDLPEKKEERMALETTDPALEVEPDELHEKEEKKERIEEDIKSSAVGSFTKEEVNKSPKKGYFGFFFLVATVTFLLGLGVIAGISYFFPSDSKNSVNLPIFSSASPTPTAEPTATPEPENVDLTAYSIRVLNGSGITGEAAKVRTLLEEKGFEIASVGNAATSDYTKTVISAKKDVEEDYLNELIKTLQDDYSVNSVVEDAPSSQTVDVVVTVGSDTAE